MERTTEDPDRKDVCHTDVRACLERMLSTKPFRDSAQMSAFITYVVNETLAGNAETVKSYTVAVEGLGKPDSFDPQSDPSVRVLANRLRSALEKYYSEAGKTDPVRIEIRRGSYVPVFRPQTASRTSAEKPRIAASAKARDDPIPNLGGNGVRMGRHRFFPTAAIVVVTIAATLAAVHLVSPVHTIFTPGDPKQYQNRAGELAVRPTISVSLVTPKPLPDWHSTTELASAFELVLSRFDDLELLEVKTGRDPPDFSRVPGDYHITVSAEPRGQAIRFFGRLIRVRDNTLIWSLDRLSEKPADIVNHDVPKVLSRTIAPVTSSNGIIFSDLAGQPDVPESLRCLIGANRYFAVRTPEGHAASLACANRLVEAGSTSASTHAVLTFLLLDAYRDDYPGLDEAPLKAAHRVALRGLELAPASARARQAMFAYFKVAGDHVNADVSGQFAVELNPYDYDILGDYASYLVSQGKIATAMPMMNLVDSVSLTTPEWFNVYLYIGALLSRERSTASRAAGRLKDHGSAMALVVRIIEHNRNGDWEDMLAAIEMLRRVEPKFAIRPKERLLRRGFSPEVANRVVKELRDAGLSADRN